MTELIQKKRAWISKNLQFISVWTYSSYRMGLADPKFDPIVLVADCSEEILGNAVVTALEQSRFLSLKESEAMRELSKEHYYKWVDKLVADCSFKSRQAMFKGMKSCNVSEVDSIITIYPSHYEGKEEWSGRGIGEDQYVKVASNSSVAEVGAAAQLAISRCN